MWKMLPVPIAVLLLAGCFWYPVGNAIPRVGLTAVERSPASMGRAPRPTSGPGARGDFFADSLIAFRTQPNLTSIRFRVWNRGREPVRIFSEPAGSWSGACPEPVDAWELRRSGPPGRVEVLNPGESREGYVTPTARVRTPLGGAWQSARLVCMVFDPAEPRAALRLGVERAGIRYDYTFWYRLVEPPREDPPGRAAGLAVPRRPAERRKADGATRTGPPGSFDPSRRR